MSSHNPIPLVKLLPQYYYIGEYVPSARLGGAIFNMANPDSMKLMFLIVPYIM